MQWLLWIASKDGASATEVSRAFDVPLPTVHHVLSTLVQECLLTKGPDRVYRMGPKIGLLADAYLRQQAIPPAFEVALRRLAEVTEETAYLAGWRGGEIRIVASVEGRRAVRVAGVQPGFCDSPHARASGKLLLALAQPGRRELVLSASDALEARTPATITDRQKLDLAFARARRNLYATDENEFIDGISCVAVPVFDGGEALHAFSVAAPTHRFLREWKFLLRAVRTAAADATSDLEDGAGGPVAADVG